MSSYKNQTFCKIFRASADVLYQEAIGIFRGFWSIFLTDFCSLFQNAEIWKCFDNIIILIMSKEVKISRENFG